MDINTDSARELLEKAKKRGATEGDIIIVEGELSSVQVRLSAIEKITDSRFKTLGLRLFFDKRSAITSTSDFSPDSLDRLIEDTCSMAKLTASDEYAGLPLRQYGQFGQIGTKSKDLEV